MGAANAWRGPGSNQSRIGNDQSRIKSNQIDSYTKPSDGGQIELKAPGAGVSEQGSESENEVADALELNKLAQMKREAEFNYEEDGDKDKGEDDDDEGEDRWGDPRIELTDPNRPTRVRTRN